MVPETHVANAALLKIFKRKIKRASKRTGKEDEGSGDSDSDLDGACVCVRVARFPHLLALRCADDDDIDDDDDDGDDNEDDSCPTGCEQSLYDKVCTPGAAVACGSYLCCLPIHAGVGAAREAIGPGGGVGGVSEGH